MTEQEAIQKAMEKAEKWNRDYLVCHRMSQGFYVIARNEKRHWADDETLIFDTGRQVEPRLDVTCEADGGVVIRP